MRIVAALAVAAALLALAPAAAAPSVGEAPLAPLATAVPGASSFVAFEAVRVLLPDGSLAPPAPVD